MMREKFNVDGMTCAACQSHVHKAVSKVNGVISVDVNLLQNNMVVEYDEKCCSNLDIEAAVSAAGYKAYKNDSKVKLSEEKKDNALITLIASILILLVLMYVSMGNMMWNFPLPNVFDHHHNPIGFALIQFIIVLPILYLNRKYFISGFKKLWKLSPNMDSLIAIGAFASMLYGIIALFMISVGNIDYHDNLYFESAGMILTLVSLGKYLEGLSKKKTTKAIEKLMDLAPKRAIVLRNSIEIDIPVEEVRVGDVVIVKKGVSIPIDGVIVEGSASIDQSNITGESMPVYKVIGDEVYSSTIITAGYIKIEATKVYEDTSIATIIKLAYEASNSKAPISKLADKISGIFVPIILGIAVITFIVNMLIGRDLENALNFAITVIVIACPCALGLATPVAIMVGTGKGAENGLLIKNAEILEKAHLIKTIVLDKTGTITEGKPKVVNYNAFTEDDIFSIIYSFEKKSEHPLALSLVEYAISKNAKELPIDEYESVDGRGIQGRIGNDLYYIGNYLYVNDLNIKDEIVEKIINEFSDKGETPIIAIKNSIIMCVLGVKDELKSTSKEAVKKLTKAGINVVMLTGDNKKTAESIAKEVGVSTVIAEVQPTDKQRIINSLKTDSKHLVAMVGDGVNDALALTSADLGIAIGGGSDIAMESSDIVLLRDDLLDVLNVIYLSKRTLRTIKINLFWAFFYNLICVLIATGIFYPSFTINPMIGSIAMSCSSVSVVLNALTINLFKVKRMNTEIEEKEEVKVNTVIINVEGMMCKHCKAHVEKACMSVNGVESAEASLENKNVTVICDNTVTKEALASSIVEAGYEVK